MPEADVGLIADLDHLAGVARRAGSIALEYFGRDPEVWHKANNSPVSVADLAVDTFLKERLTGWRPDYGWLSEETEDDDRRIGRDRVFVVDPIDGTRGFLAGTDEWTVSLAIVEAGRPVVGVVYRPVTGTLFAAATGLGARRDGRLIQVGARETLGGASVAGPPAMLRTIAAHVEGMGETKMSSRYISSLALRIALVASGELDMAVAKKNAHDWDLAAADLILGEAGGALVDEDGLELVYNRADPVHPALVAATRPVAALVWPLVRRQSTGENAPAY
ncbi:3'(2'),5'-bisphosphate nucleotidase CysQ [Methylobrevis pamukkalensis]|uniref:3'(2'),5'-bisphosphate nucleotidase CysQ n=1 Tax=Methylobrevis pamukkalensis TaxID=1439726 RepID=A0A1E3H5K4_9HYPH|nr:3'(2'),5'-bisphosphate nucleotidase CysQ [Methylobrevis pamukkalensis]ODN71618.1 3'(2'),5'-bisphosphate nucleotidase CysQ [Methylobrevis pamukkalensis]